MIVKLNQKSILFTELHLAVGPDEGRQSSGMLILCLVLSNTPFCCVVFLYTVPFILHVAETKRITAEIPQLVVSSGLR